MELSRGPDRQRAELYGGGEATAKNGDLTLTGTVQYLSRRPAVETAVSGQIGVCNVRNEIGSSPASSSPATSGTGQSTTPSSAPRGWRGVATVVDELEVTG